MKVGPLLVEIHGTPERRVTPHHDDAYYFESIHALCGILGEVPWLLAGGLAVPFTLGRFFREHGDIDIMVPLGSMSAASKKFRSAGYQLFRRIMISHHARRFVIRYPVDIVTEIKPNLNCAMLRIDGQGQHPILDKIDVHPYQIEAGLLQSDYRGPALAIFDSIQSPPIKTGYNTLFRCLNLHYVAQLKQVRHSLKHQIDLTAIEQGISKAMLQVNQANPVN